MKPSPSHSLLLVWQIAEMETRHLHTEVIAPHHLLIGLCKIVDVDLPSLLPKDAPDRDAILEELLREVRRVRTVFHTTKIDPRTLRRNLRRASEGSHDVALPKGTLHRTTASKDVFADAERFAEVAGSPVFPIHLLYALVLTKDLDRDAVLSDLGCSLARLVAATKQETLRGAGSGSGGTNQPIHQRN